MDGPKTAGHEERSGILISKVRDAVLIPHRAKIRFNHGRWILNGQMTDHEEKSDIIVSAISKAAPTIGYDQECHATGAHGRGLPITYRSISSCLWGSVFK